MKKRICLVLGLVVIISVIGYAGVHVYAFLYIPPDQHATEKVILIEQGTPLRLVAEQLEAVSVITDKHLFMILARFYRDGKSIKAGEYKFTTSMLPTEVLEMLQDGKIYFRIATIPEGYTARQIAELLDNLGFANKDPFLQVVFDQDFASELGIKADNLEGYLFPNTYYIHRGMSEKEIIQNMVKQFWQVMTPELQQEVEQQGFTVHQIVTLASIIEKEAKVAAERELISAVYHNRLNLKMKLDSDPTVIYGIENFNGNLTKTDLKTDSPYNTYKHRGLPPGPIANPGKPCILAAIHPADVKYLYFVSRNDGTHHFSTTYRDHLRAVRQYQKNRRKSGS